MKDDAKVIQIFLPTGDPRGVRIAEITTRIVRAIELPRVHLSSFFESDEADQVGLYFLFGQNPEEDPELYIGQTGVLRDRLKLHHREKAFWKRAVLFVSTSNNFTQTHTQYLEWVAIGKAREIGRYKLLNGNAGAKPYTPRAMEAECLEVEETISILLSTLGHPVFEPLLKRPADAAVVPRADEEEIFFCKGPGAEGRGVFTEDGFVVLSGSSGRLDGAASMKGTDQQYRQGLIDEGVVAVSGGSFVFQKDYLISSPSRAAAILMGRSANGWTEWKRLDGKTADEALRSLTPLE